MWCKFDEMFILIINNYKFVSFLGRVLKYKFTILQVQDKNQSLGLISLKEIDVMVFIGPRLKQSGFIRFGLRPVQFYSRF